MSLDPGAYQMEFLQEGALKATAEFTLAPIGQAVLTQTFITSEDFGIAPTGDANTNRVNIQNFIDFCAENNVTGVLGAGEWVVNDQLNLHNGLRFMGRGAGRTFINALPGSWDGNAATVMRLDTSMNDDQVNDRGLYLADFRAAGPDKTRSDSGGGLIRLHGLNDFVIERLRLEDASSYNLFIAGYGPGPFSNDITLPSWNATHRGTVRDCLAIRGQIGFGTEGGAEGILFQRCASIGNFGTADDDWGLHAYRSASGYNVWYDRCRAVGYRNGFLLDRYRNMMLSGCYMHKCRNGMSPGSFYDTDPEISHDLRIVHNYFDCQDEGGSQARAINDSYVGSNRRVDGVIIQGNVVKNGNILLNRCRQMNVQGNTAMNSTSVISTGSSATGLVANNTMNFNNSAAGVVDGGNNSFIPA